MSQQSIQTDYYKILNVCHEATTQQICLAYRQIALKFHPNLQHINKNEAYRIFCQASQAFDVLYDDQKRSIYNQYGQRRLKEGIPDDKESIGSYKLTSDPEQTFQKFFGSKNVYDHLLEVGTHQGYSHPIFRNQYPPEQESHTIQDLVVTVPCNLTELYNGCKKVLKYAKRVTSVNGQSCAYVMQQSCEQTSIVYQNEGHDEPGYKKSKLIFKIQQIPQKNYTRSGDNLIYTAKISLMDALDSKSITITQLNGQVLQLHFDEIISPQTQRIIQGQGMTNCKRNTCGNLIVKFDIEFPQELPMQRKNRIIQLLTQ